MMLWSFEGNGLTPVFHGRLSKNTLGSIDGHAVVPQPGQHLPQVLLMLSLIAARNENIVQIDEGETEILEDLVHQALESFGAVLHAELHPEILK